MNKNLAQEKKYKRIILALSIVIPLAVAALFGINLQKLGFDVEPLTFLPPIYASINAITAIVLVAAVIAIKKGNRKLHEGLNTFAIFCSLLFLVMYVAYHMTTERTNYGGEGALKYMYYFILGTHILFYSHRRNQRREGEPWCLAAVVGPSYGSSLCCFDKSHQGSSKS